MSLLLDALRRAGAARDEAIAEPLARAGEHAAGEAGAPEQTRAADHDREPADGGLALEPTTPAPTDAEPAAPAAPATSTGERGAPGGPARAETVFRGGARPGVALRSVALAVGGTLILAATAAAAGWYYYQSVRTDVDRTLARYEPERAAAPMADERTAGEPTAAAGPGAAAEPASERTGADSASGRSTPDAGAARAIADAGDNAGPAARQSASARPVAEVAETRQAQPATSDPGTREVASAPASSSPGAQGEMGAQAPASAPADDEPVAAATGASADPGEARTGAAESGAAPEDPAGEAPLVRASAEATPLGDSLRAGYAALQAGHVEAAADHYERALSAAPDNRDALLGAAAVAVRQGEPTRAARYYRRILSDRPNDPWARAGIAALEAGGDSRRSERELRALLNDDPDAPALRFALGNLYARDGRWSQAQSAYFRAFSGAPDNPDYAFNLAVALDHLGQRDAARDYYEQALQLARGRAVGFSPEAARRRLERLSR